MRASFIPLAVLLVISGTAVADEGDAPQDQPAMFKITTKRKDDSVAVRADKDKAVIERQEGTWPQAVVLRLHLKGLSSFRASNGKVTLDAAVSIQEGRQKVRACTDGQEDAPWTRKAPSGRTSAS